MRCLDDKSLHHWGLFYWVKERALDKFNKGLCTALLTHATQSSS